MNNSKNDKSVLQDIGIQKSDKNDSIDNKKMAEAELQ